MYDCLQLHLDERGLRRKVRSWGSSFWGSKVRYYGDYKSHPDFSSVFCFREGQSGGPEAAELAELHLQEAGPSS